MGSDPIKTPVLFFHGFWGQSSDWDFLKAHHFQNNFQAVPYMQIPELSSTVHIMNWGAHFLKWKSQKWGEAPIRAVGYSQGGRLLLQAFQQNPSCFQQLILISSHPGFQNPEEREARIKSDKIWAQKFRTLSWAELDRQWNSQAVFQMKVSPLRKNSEQDRESLALCFENWSLGYQQDFREIINQYPDKISIILGDEDAKYVGVYRDFLKDTSRLRMEKGAAHRVPFDQPKSLVETLNLILN